MSETFAEQTQVDNQPSQIPTSAKLAISSFVFLTRVALHPKTYFEDGAVEEIEEHRDNSGSLLILMTHFKRLEPGYIAHLAGAQRALRHIRYTTGITAREEIFDVPFIGYILRNTPSQIVKRSTEHLHETPEEKALRKESNQRAQAIGGRVLASGFNWLIFPEGSSKQDVYTDDGRLVRTQRDPSKLLPVRSGFVYSLENMSAAERDRVKLLGVAVHYNEGLLSNIRPTIFVSRPVSPIQGSHEDMRLQGQQLLQYSLDEAIRIKTTD